MVKLYNNRLKVPTLETQEAEASNVVEEKTEVVDKPDKVEVKDTVKVVEPPKVDPQKYLGGVFESRPSAPTYNTSADRQDKAMMQAQTFGNLLSLLGDVGGVAMGAPVARRGMKPLEPYMQSIQNRRAQFEKDKRVFSRQEFLDKMKEGGRLDAEKKYQDKLGVAAEQQEHKRDREEIIDARYDTEWEHKLGREKETDSRWWANWKRSNEAGKERMRLEYAKLKAKGETKEKPAMYANIDGKEIGIKEGMAGKMAQEAIDWLNKYSDKDYSEYIDEIQSGGMMKFNLVVEVISLYGNI